ncbi:unnamed protein product, partial [Polarella glacialis]
SAASRCTTSEPANAFWSELCKWTSHSPDRWGGSGRCCSVAPAQFPGRASRHGQWWSSQASFPGVQARLSCCWHGLRMGSRPCRPESERSGCDPGGADS